MHTGHFSSNPCVILSSLDQAGERCGGIHNQFFFVSRRFVGKGIDKLNIFKIKVTSDYL